MSGCSYAAVRGPRQSSAPIPPGAYLVIHGNIYSLSNLPHRPQPCRALSVRYWQVRRVWFTDVGEPMFFGDFSGC